MKPEQILKKMTLQQKVAFLSGDGDWHTKAIPELGVQAVAMADGPNGLRIETNQLTRDSLPAICYPAMAALASTWDRALAARLAQALAEECRAASLDILLGPGANIKRSPLCGRNFEYLSEDPYLASELAFAYVRALQQGGVSACLKHFALNNQEFCRMTVNVRVGQRPLHEIYLKAFEKTVREAHPDTVMSAYNRVNGEQMAESSLLRDVLRGAWGFDGVVISDWGSVSQRDGGVAVGMDLEMPDSHGKFDGDVYAALEDGRLSEQQLDDCVLRLLQFAETCAQRRQNAQPSQPMDEQAHLALAREIAARAMVLLKNDGETLPLHSGSRVAVIGEFARTPRYQGGGSAHVRPAQLEVPLDCLRKAYPDLIFTPGYRLDGGDAALADAAVQAAEQAEVTLVFAGLPDAYEAECYDRMDLELPAEQNELIARICRANPKTVVVLFAGSAVTMPWAQQAKSILMAYLPGQAVGSALTDVLTGVCEPTGRLSETFPARLEDTPSYGNFPGDGSACDYAEGIYVGYRWYDKRKIDPQFSFGQGEGYTQFAYRDISLSAGEIDADGAVQVNVTVQNIGTRKGREVVQLYAAQESGQWGYVRQLKGFETLELAPGQISQVSFTLRAEDLSVWSEREQRFWVQDGVYILEAAHHSRDIRCRAKLAVHTGDCERAPQGRNVNVRQLLADTRTRAMAEEIYADMLADRAARDPNFDRSKAERLGQSLFLSYPARNFIDICSAETATQLEERVYREMAALE
mgnify:FL=1